MINNCAPSKKHYRCGKCGKRFSKITGDCISISDVHPKCPHCNSEEIIFTEEEVSISETIDELADAFKMIFGKRR